MEFRLLEDKNVIKLKRSAKGIYHWEIKVKESDGVNLIEEIDRIDRELRRKYIKEESK